MAENMEIIEVEKNLLSGLMLDEGLAIPIAAEMLTANDFYRPEHRKIYNALLELSDENVPVNILLLERKLLKKGELKGIGRQYLFSLVEREYTSARTQQYCRAVKQAAVFRRLKEIGSVLIGEASAENKDPNEITAWLDKELASLASSQASNMESARDIILRQVKIALTDDVERGLETKYRYFDKNLGGFKKSDLIIIAARPSMGKTALALNLAANVAREHNVAFFSLEMSKAQLGNRLLAADGMINANRLQQGKLNDNEKSYLAAATEHLEKIKLDIDDTGALSMYDLKQRARKLHREKGLDLIIVDYLQLIRASKEYKGNRVQEVSEISRELKALAREMDIPIIALSQLSRSVELRADKRPQLSDLRESGSIEQDADVVIFLYRDEYYDKDTQLSNVAEIIVAKNRNGKTTNFKMHYEPNYLLFSDLAREG